MIASREVELVLGGKQPPEAARENAHQPPKIENARWRPGSETRTGNCGSGGHSGEPPDGVVGASSVLD